MNTINQKRTAEVKKTDELEKLVEKYQSIISSILLKKKELARAKKELLSWMGSNPENLVEIHKRYMTADSQYACFQCEKRYLEREILQRLLKRK